MSKGTMNNEQNDKQMLKEQETVDTPPDASNNNGNRGKFHLF